MPWDALSIKYPPDIRLEDIARRFRPVEAHVHGKTLRANTAHAKGDCELALLDERTFRVTIEETPGFVWYVINEFAARLRATNALL
jgi:hypothetical protein